VLPGFAPGEQAVLDGGCLTLAESDTSMVELSNLSFVRIQGLEVRNLRTSDYRVVPWGIQDSNQRPDD
jgi:hypothetical protein